jgi:hypothetical protein
MAAALIRQGEDKKILVDLPFNVGTIVTFPTITNTLKCVFRNGRTAASTKVGSEIDMSDTQYGVIENHASNPNQVYLVLKEDLTKNFPVGSIYALFVAEFVDADFTPDGRDSETEPIHILQIQPSLA